METIVMGGSSTGKLEWWGLPDSRPVGISNGMLLSGVRCLLPPSSILETRESLLVPYGHGTFTSSSSTQVCWCLSCAAFSASCGLPVWLSAYGGHESAGKNVRGAGYHGTRAPTTSGPRSIPSATPLSGPAAAVWELGATRMYSISARTSRRHPAGQARHCPGQLATGVVGRTRRMRS